MVHGQIISEFYTILMNLGPTTCRKRTKKRGSQAVTTTPPQHRREGYEKLTEGPSMTGIPKPGGSRFGGTPISLSLCTHISSPGVHFASHLAASSAEVASHDTSWSPLGPSGKS
jgi:hypothetical protein